MQNAAFRLISLLLAASLTSGCATAVPVGSPAKRPMLFHDTRLQYGLLTNDRLMLRQDFNMGSEPDLVERVVSGLVLPFAAATETTFWPLSASIKTYLGE